MSEPASRPVRPAASAAAEPPEDPPGPRARSHGLFVVPWIALKVCQSASIRGTLVLPKTMAPAASSRCTASASRRATLSFSAGSPQVVRMPATSKLSLIVIGTPSRGRPRSPLARARSAARAALRARATASSTTALMRGLCALTRAR